MSAVFAKADEPRSKRPESTSVKRLLDENEFIIELINDLSQKGHFEEAIQMQDLLQRNLLYLVSLADSQEASKSVNQTASLR